MALFILTVQFARVLISETDSLPQHFFLQFPYIKPKLGEYTVIKSAWYGGKIIKKIMGVAGDRIWYDPQGILWIGDRSLGLLHEYATDHRQLTPIVPQIIPNNKVFLGATHERSFDSRYKELDLVDIKDLAGRVVPLW